MKIISKIVIGLFVVFSVVAVSGIEPVLVDDSSEDSLRWRGGLHFGVSQYTGIIGAELQKCHWGFTIGMPAALGVRYYLGERGYRWFFGAHAMYYDIDEADEIKDGIRYEERTSTTAGLGMGYKWRLKNHWDIILSLSIAYQRDELKNDFVSRTDDYILAIPGLTIGYTF